MEILWDQTARAAWDRAASMAAWQQHWAYGSACEQLGSRVIRAEVRAQGRTIALAQFVCRSFLGLAHAAVCTRGPVWPMPLEPETRAEVYDLLRRSIPLPRLRGVFITPDSDDTERGPLRLARMAEVMTPYTTALLDLSADRATLRERQKGKWRNRLVQAEGAGLSISPHGDCAWLLEREQSQQRTRRYAALPPGVVAAWQRAAGPRSVLTVAASNGKAQVAAMLFLIHGKTATYHIGWSNDTGRAVSAHNLILWRALKMLQRQGVVQLDLGGLNTEDTPGIARFKLGTGARMRTLCGTWF